MVLRLQSEKCRTGQRLLTGSCKPVGSNLNLTVDKLLGNESIHLLIPTTVDTNDNAAEYVNTARITEISGAEHELKSETTYHQKGREVRGLTIKTVPDLDPKDADSLVCI